MPKQANYNYCAPSFGLKLNRVIVKRLRPKYECRRKYPHVCAHGSSPMNGTGFALVRQHFQIQSLCQIKSSPGLPAAQISVKIQSTFLVHCKFQLNNFVGFDIFTYFN